MILNSYNIILSPNITFNLLHFYTAGFMDECACSKFSVFHSIVLASNSDVLRDVLRVCCPLD